VAEPTPPVPLPAGRLVALPDRGPVFVREASGPPGAPTVVLLHGWTATADLNWLLSYGPLSDHFHVLAMDHRGHGRGIRSRRPFRLEDCADDVAALALATGTSRLIAIGYSMGGPIAQLLWRRHPDLVAGLVLCATARTFAGNGPADRLFVASLFGLSVAASLTPGPIRRQVTDSFLRRRVEQSRNQEWVLAQLRRNDPAAVLQAGIALRAFNSKPWAGEIDVPTAVVVTTRDQVVHPRRQLALAEAIPGATVYPVDGDHGACVDVPRRFVPALLAAAGDVATRSAAGRSSGALPEPV